MDDVEDSSMLSQISQRKIFYHITYLWTVKNTTTKYNKKEARLVENKQVITSGERDRGAI